MLHISLRGHVESIHNLDLANKLPLKRWGLSIAIGGNDEVHSCSQSAHLGEYTLVLVWYHHFDII